MRKIVVKDSFPLTSIMRTNELTVEPLGWAPVSHYRRKKHCASVSCLNKIFRATRKTAPKGEDTVKDDEAVKDMQG